MKVHLNPKPFKAHSCAASMGTREEKILGGQFLGSFGRNWECNKHSKFQFCCVTKDSNFYCTKCPSKENESFNSQHGVKVSLKCCIFQLWNLCWVKVDSNLSPCPQVVFVLQEKMFTFVVKPIQSRKKNVALFVFKWICTFPHDW